MAGTPPSSEAKQRRSPHQRAGRPSRSVGAWQRSRLARCCREQGPPHHHHARSSRGGRSPQWSHRRIGGAMAGTPPDRGAGAR
eukprot:scaffold2792_cov112-Isochrysis_galbana.AAC.1